MIKTIKVSELPNATSIDNLEMLGVDTINNKSVRVSAGILISTPPDGKGFSTNDYSDEEKAKVNGKANSADVYDKLNIDAKIEQARIAINLTPEQIAALNVNLTPIENELNAINPFPLTGKKMLVLGDSLSSSGGGSMDAPAVGSWCKYTRNLLGLSAESRVIAQGGATCTDKNATTIKTDKTEWGGDNNVLSNQVYSVIDHYKKNKGSANEFTPDIIGIMVGTNNAHTNYPDPMWNIVAGQWADCMYSQFTDADFDLYDLTNPTQTQRYNALKERRKKFYTAYRWAIEALLHWFPNSSIYILSPMANSGGRGQNIFENTVPACKKVADFMSCGWIDVHNRSGLSFYSNTRKGNGWSDYWYTFDGTHPNFDAGMELVGRFVAVELLRSYFAKPPIKAIKVPMQTEDVYYTISIVNANADTAFGTTNPNTAQQVIKGGSLTVNILPANGYRVYSVKVDGVEQGGIGSYTFTNVQANHELIAEFAIGEAPPVTRFTVTGASNNNSFGTVTPAVQEVEQGGTANITATASQGYVIESWTGATTSTGVGATSGTATLTNVQTNKTITCNFKAESVTPPPTGDKAILSFGWKYENNGVIEDGVTMVYFSGLTSVNTGIPIGAICLNGRGSLNYNNTIGAVTGDNSGIYPDKFLERGIMYSEGTGVADQGDFTISNMENGTYRVGVLTNISSKSNWANYTASTSDVLLTVNGVEKHPAKIADNVDTLTVFENIVVSDGVLRILTNISAKSKRCMFNAIEIERLNK